MDEEVSKFVYGAIGGGLVAVVWSALEKYWVGVRLSESLDAKKKLRFYAKPLWLESHFLQERLEYIVRRSKELNSSESEPWGPLRLSPQRRKVDGMVHERRAAHNLNRVYDRRRVLLDTSIPAGCRVPELR